MRLATCTQDNVTVNQGLVAEPVICVKKDIGEIQECNVLPATATQVELIPTRPSVTLRLENVSV